MQRNTHFALLVAALLSAPVVAHAQTAPPVASAATEADGLRQRIARLQQQALGDPSLKAPQDSVNAEVQRAMARLDAAAPAKAERATALAAEVAAARAASDNAKLNQLADEATQLKAYFDALRPRAMEDTRVQAAREVYVARLFERMKQIDPNVQQYVDRLSELQRGGPASGGGSPQ